MAKLERITGKIFGATASSSGDNPDIGQFGSAKAGTYNGTGNVAEIQALPAWDNGWIDAVTPTQQFPTLPEMTGVHKVLSYQNAYLLKEGMPEYDPGTIYDIGGMCKIDKITYYCTLNNNTNDPRTLNGWIIYYDPDATASNLIPFCVNSGSVNSNGDGNCLTLPSGSTTVVTRTFVRPNLTADGTMGGDSFAVSANGYNTSSNYYAYLAFDGNNNTFWEYPYAPTATNYIIFYNPVELNVTELDIIVYGWTNSIGTYNDNINIYGSNDNATWTQLASNVPSGSYGIYQYKNVNVDLSSNTNSYKYYKIENTASSYSQYFGYGWAIANVGITATYQETIASSENLILEGHTVPVVLTNAKGLTSVINEDLTKDVSSGYADGDYNVFVENGDLEIYQNIIYRQKKEPTYPNQNDIWLNTSIRSLISYKYNGSEWEEYEGIPVGVCTIESNNVTTVKTFPYNVNGTYFVGCEYYQNGTEGYSTEWRYNQNTHTIMKYCEQWGETASISSGTTQEISLLKIFANTNYNIELTPCYTVYQGYANVSGASPYQKTSSKFYIYLYLVGNSNATVMWKVSGYLKEGE